MNDRSKQGLMLDHNRTLSNSETALLRVVFYSNSPCMSHKPVSSYLNPYGPKPIILSDCVTFIQYFPKEHLLENEVCLPVFFSHTE